MTDDKTARAKRLMERVAHFQNPSVIASSWQLVNSFTLLFLAFWAAWFTYRAGYAYGWTACFSVLAGGLLLRIFIIQHDCGHGSFFPSRRANDIVGTVCSFFTLIPYLYWRKQHAIHHASNGNLDGRGHGDIDVLTVREYRALSPFGRLRYRLYRHPIGMLVLGPIFFFLIVNRFAFDRKKTSARERASVYWTNGALALLVVALGTLAGWRTFAAVALPALFTAGAAGIWIFYVQHQFEHTYWKPEDEWSYVAAAMQGSSFYKLPRVLQWFTGNIGFHHIHHLKPLVPNYRLEQCHEALPEVRNVPTLTLWSSLRTIFLVLWDEEQQRLISFREFRRLSRSADSAPHAA